MGPLPGENETRSTAAGLDLRACAASNDGLCSDVEADEPRAEARAEARQDIVQHN
jgi:hypothetical protein